MFKVKTVKLVEDKDNISTEELISPVLLDILNNLLLVKANINVFVLKNKLEDIPKDVIVSESNMIEMDDTNPFAIGHDLFTNEEKNRLKKFFKSIKNGAFLLFLEKSNTIIRLIDFIGISIMYSFKKMYLRGILDTFKKDK